MEVLSSSQIDHVSGGSPIASYALNLRGAIGETLAMTLAGYSPAMGPTGNMVWMGNNGMFAVYTYIQAH